MNENYENYEANEAENYEANETGKGGLGLGVVVGAAAAAGVYGLFKLGKKIHRKIKDRKEGVVTSKAEVVKEDKEETEEK